MWFLLIYIHLKLVNALSDFKVALASSLHVTHHYPLPDADFLQDSVFSPEQIRKVWKVY